jgi:hypothetical protein
VIHCHVICADKRGIKVLHCITGNGSDSTDQARDLYCTVLKWLTDQAANQMGCTMHFFACPRSGTFTIQPAPVGSGSPWLTRLEVARICVFYRLLNQSMQCVLPEEHILSTNIEPPALPVTKELAARVEAFCALARQPCPTGSEVSLWINRLGIRPERLPHRVPAPTHAYHGHIDPEQNRSAEQIWATEQSSPRKQPSQEREQDMCSSHPLSDLDEAPASHRDASSPGTPGRSAGMSSPGAEQEIWDAEKADAMQAKGADLPPESEAVAGMDTVAVHAAQQAHIRYTRAQLEQIREAQIATFPDQQWPLPGVATLSAGAQCQSVRSALESMQARVAVKGRAKRSDSPGLWQAMPEPSRTWTWNQRRDLAADQTGTPPCTPGGAPPGLGNDRRAEIEPRPVDRADSTQHNQKGVPSEQPSPQAPPLPPNSAWRTSPLRLQPSTTTPPLPRAGPGNARPTAERREPELQEPVIGQNANGGVCTTVQPRRRRARGQGRGPKQANAGRQGRG